MCPRHEIIRIYIISNSATLNISNFVLQNISNKLACISIKSSELSWRKNAPKRNSKGKAKPIPLFALAKGGGDHRLRWWVVQKRSFP